MPRKLNLSYKKHGSVKRKSRDVPEEVNGVVHSSTQPTDEIPVTDETPTTDKTPATDTISTQTDSVETCDVGVQTAKEPLCDHPNLLTPLPFSATVKVDIEVFYSLRVIDINQLQMRLSYMKCIFGDWCLVPAKLQADKLQLIRFGQQQPKSSFMIEVSEDLKWSLQLPCEQLSPGTSLFLKHLPECVATLLDLRSILTFLDQCTVCQGNPDPKFAPIVAHSKGIFRDRSGESLILNVSRYMHYV